ncbi:hypothetical protein BSR29_00490 [Boudabousia liubingyangii]|uniref:Uncharacterized protein n=2 Tax=Boudabousia liubingyangii TaxID=1921764 RepID=A0A1Q5PPY4_9ACTO|nr:hypothetical protein BSR29_00490 [Boudabousia liubingyangii]
MISADRCKTYVKSKDKDQPKYDHFNTILYQAKLKMHSAKELADSRPSGIEKINKVKDDLLAHSKEMDTVCQYVFSKHPELKTANYKTTRAALSKTVSDSEKLLKRIHKCNIEKDDRLKYFEWNLKSSKQLLQEKQKPDDELQKANIEMARVNLETSRTPFEKLLNDMRNNNSVKHC